MTDLNVKCLVCGEQLNAIKDLYEPVVLFYICDNSGCETGFRSRCYPREAAALAALQQRVEELEDLRVAVDHYLAMVREGSDDSKAYALSRVFAESEGLTDRKEREA